MKCFTGRWLSWRQEAAAWARHAAMCRTCAEARAAEHALESQLRGDAKRVGAPSDLLHQRVMVSVRQAAAEQQATFLPRWGWAIAGVPLLVVAAVLVLRPSPTAHPHASNIDLSEWAGAAMSIQSTAPDLAMAPVRHMQASMAGEWDNLVADLAGAGDYLLRSVAAD